jgi:hypothetical protein
MADVVSLGIIQSVKIQLKEAGEAINAGALVGINSGDGKVYNADATQAADGYAVSDSATDTDSTLKVGYASI